MFSKIFVFYDLSVPSRKALQCALQIAEMERSELTIFHVLSPQAYSPEDWQLQKESINRLIRQQVDRDLYRLKTGKKFPGMHSMHLEIIEGKPISTIENLIIDRSPELVVLGTHGRSGWSHIRLGSVAEQIIRFSPSPVLICRGAFKWPPQRILVPVDVKEPMDESLFMASALTLEEKGNVELYNVITLTQYAAAGADSLIAPVDVTPIHDKITTQLKDLTLPYFETKFDVAVGEGQVANEICRRAEQIAADFIIIPTHGRKGLTRFLMGSVAEQVIRYATCSVLSFCPQKWATEQREMVKSILRDERTGFSEDTELGVVD